MSTTQKLLVDALLVLGFGVQHSILATLRVKRVVKAKLRLEALAWRSIESLTNAVYILVAASLWQSTGDVVWSLSGVPKVGFLAVAGAAWLWYFQLHLFEHDVGRAFGSTTFVAHLAGAEQPRAIPWRCGSRNWVRFPVHTAFWGMFFFLPTMTTDLLVLAVLANLYNIVGSVLFDKRIAKVAGPEYADYVRVTGLLFPPVYRAPRGAEDLTMSGPVHWRRPWAHVPGLVVGLGLGALYLLVLGTEVTTPADHLMVGLVALGGAIVAGLVIGTVAQPDDVDWQQQQTDLATTGATAAAVGVVTWIGLTWVTAGTVPSFATYLPMWFIVQYLSHVFAFLADREKWSAALAHEGADAPTTADVRDVLVMPVRDRAGSIG